MPDDASGTSSGVTIWWVVLRVDGIMRRHDPDFVAHAARWEWHQRRT